MCRGIGWVGEEVDVWVGGERGEGAQAEGGVDCESGSAERDAGEVTQHCSSWARQRFV